MKVKENIIEFLLKFEKSIVFKLFQFALIFAWVIFLFNTSSYFIIYAICGLLSVIALIINQKNSKSTVSVYIITTACSFVFSVLVLLANYDLFLPCRGKFFQITITLIGGFTVAQNILLLLYHRFPATNAKINKISFTKQLAAFFIPFIIFSSINLLYLFLSAYPGNLSPDSLSQLEQAINGITSNHHPVWHTLLIKIIVKIGLTLFGNINDAVALYCICQLLFLTAAFAFSLMTLYMAGVKKRYIILCGLPFAILPYHVAYSVTIWKDVVFSASALFLVTFLFRSLKNIGNKVINMIFLFIFVVMFCVLRSNAWLAMVASVIFFYIYFRKKNFKINILITVAVLLSWVLGTPLLSAKGIQQPDFVESISIPVQQIARVVVDEKQLTKSQYQLLNKIMDVDEVKSLYLSYLSDPIKNEIRSKNQSYLVEHKGEYLKLWIQLGIQHPDSYVKAWVDQTKGYYNSGYSYWIFYNWIDSNNLGVTKRFQDNPINTFFKGSINAIQKHVIAQPFISIGFCVWILTALGITAFLRRREEIILYVPLIMVIATLLVATPVFSEFRYAYSIFTTLPFLLTIGVHNFIIEKGEKNNG